MSDFSKDDLSSSIDKLVNTKEEEIKQINQHQLKQMD